MAFKVEDGTGSRNKVAVIENRIRTFAVENSLVNYQSVKGGNITKEEILNGEVIGVFTVRGSENFLLTPGNKIAALSISNNDPINLMIIDRAYIQVFSSTVSLPNPNIIVAIDNEISVTIPATTNLIVNDNRYSNIFPISLSRLNNAGREIGSITNLNTIRIYPTLGDISELIIPGIDSIILPGRTTIAAGNSDINTASISLFNIAGGNITLGYETFIRFSMISPGDAG